MLYEPDISELTVHSERDQDSGWFYYRVGERDVMNLDPDGRHWSSTIIESLWTSIYEIKGTEGHSPIVWRIVIGTQSVVEQENQTNDCQTEEWSRLEQTETIDLIEDNQNSLELYKE